MFVGHVAVALGAKRAAPRIPLGLLVGAAIALDLIWPILLLAGVETVRIDPGNTAFTPLAFAFPARDATGRWASRVLIALMAIIWATQPWSPPPPSATAIAVVGVSMWLFPLWAAWIERHRGKGST